MKKFTTLFTFLLLIYQVQGQLAIGTFNTISDDLIPFPFSNVATATLSTPGVFSPAGCFGGSRTLTGSTATISMAISPNAGFDLIFTALAITLKHDQDVQTSGTAVLTINGNPFGTAQTFNNTCAFLIFSDDLVTASTIAININVTYDNESSKVLTIDNIVVGGTVIAAVLPVEISKFNVKKAQQSVMLSWATATEKNNDHFDIQKSANGTQFQTIGQVKGGGTNLSGASYDFEDKNPSVGVAYYRLKQVDADGKFEYSTVRSILFGKSKLSVFSTIAKEKISITVSDDQTVPYDIINLNGQKVLAGKAIGQHTIDISGLHSGMYFIRTEGGEVSRFVKE